MPGSAATLLHAKELRTSRSLVGSLQVSHLVMTSSRFILFLAQLIFPISSLRSMNESWCQGTEPESESPWAVSADSTTFHRSEGRLQTACRNCTQWNLGQFPITTTRKLVVFIVAWPLIKALPIVFYEIPPHRRHKPRITERCNADNLVLLLYTSATNHETDSCQCSIHHKMILNCENLRTVPEFIFIFLSAGTWIFQCVLPFKSHLLWTEMMTWA